MFFSFSEAGGNGIMALLAEGGIPKPGGGVRQLGIPTVVDRLIQQALLQDLQPEGDGTFFGQSFGFRPKPSAHQAVGRAQKYIQSGYGWEVDIDLEKFFDRVNHDKLVGLESGSRTSGCAR